VNKILRYIAGVIIILTCLIVTSSSGSEFRSKEEVRSLSESLDDMGERVSIAPNVSHSVTHPVSNPVHPIFKVELLN
jgi:hypothetical protein